MHPFFRKLGIAAAVFAPVVLLFSYPPIRREVVDDWYTRPTVEQRRERLARRIALGKIVFREATQDDVDSAEDDHGNWQDQQEDFERAWRSK